MTLLRRLSFIFVFLFLATLVFIVLSKWIFAGISAILTVSVGIRWYIELGDELVIYHLKKNNGSMTKQAIFEECPKNTMSALLRLRKKQIVQFDDEMVHLVRLKQVCTFDRCKI